MRDRCTANRAGARSSDTATPVAHKVRSYRGARWQRTPGLSYPRVQERISCATAAPRTAPRPGRTTSRHRSRMRCAPTGARAV